MACGLALVFIRPSWVALGDRWAPSRPVPSPWQHSTSLSLPRPYTVLQSDSLAARTGSLWNLPAIRLSSWFLHEGNHGVQLYNDFSERVGFHAPESPERGV